MSASGHVGRVAPRGNASRPPLKRTTAEIEQTSIALELSGNGREVGLTALALLQSPSSGSVSALLSKANRPLALPSWSGTGNTGSARAKGKVMSRARIDDRPAQSTVGRRRASNNTPGQAIKDGIERTDRFLLRPRRSRLEGRAAPTPLCLRLHLLRWPTSLSRRTSICGVLRGHLVFEIKHPLAQPVAHGGQAPIRTPASVESSQAAYLQLWSTSNVRAGRRGRRESYFTFDRCVKELVCWALLVEPLKGESGVQSKWRDLIGKP